MRNPLHSISAPSLPAEFSAFLAALQLRGAQSHLLNQLTEIQWRELISFCERSQLILLLTRIDHKSFPGWVVERLDRNLADNIKRAERIKATYNEAAKALADADVAHLVIKGFTQIPRYAPSISLRSQSDIDLYCPKEQLLQAKAALQEIGYVADNALDYRNADHLPTLVRKGNWIWRGNHFDPDMPLSIELHFSLWNSRLCAAHFPEIERFWERRQTRRIGDFHFEALHPVDQLGYFSLHILRNLMLGSWAIHHVFELANFLHNHTDNEEFWRDWKRMHTPALRSHQAIAFVYAKSWFNCDLPNDVELEIANLSPAIQHWLILCTGSSLKGMFSENKDWVFLNVALLSSEAEKTLWLRRHLFPQRLPPTNTPSITYKNRRPRDVTKAVTSEPLKSASPLQYAQYLLSRVIVHIFVISRTLCKGFLWWLATPTLNKSSSPPRGSFANS
jgi:hypothetical protein